MMRTYTILRPLARVATVLLVALACVPAQAERIKELASVQGVRQNQLIGYGLVVGLDGSGDQTTQAPFTAQSVQSMLSQLGSPIFLTNYLRKTAQYYFSPY